MSKNFYYAKLNNGFCDTHDVKEMICEENGFQYFYIYMWLMCESVKHEGDLPYTEDTLLKILPRGVDDNVLHDALEFFKDKEILSVSDNGFYFPSLAVDETSNRNEYMKNYMREKRAKSALAVEEIPVDEPAEEKPKRKVFIPPELSEVETYFYELGCNADMANSFYDYYVSCDWHVGNKKMKDWKASARNWKRNDSRYGNKPAYGKKADALSSFINGVYGNG